MGIIISAYPCCGKTYSAENLSDKYKIIDLDSSKFSWIKRTRTEEEIDDIRKEYESKAHLKTFDREKYANEIITVKNPNFIEDYMHAIKKAAEENDVVFVSSHKKVRQALQDNNLSYYTIYPENKESVKNEWLGRMYSRGSDEVFMKFQSSNWDEFTSNIDNEPHGKQIIRLSNGEYISEKLLEKLIFLG